MSTDDDRRRSGCPHTSVAEEAGSPDRSGRCHVYAVCEDCGTNLGHVGEDSIL